jgi:hypothetical protein
MGLVCQSIQTYQGRINLCVIEPYAQKIG